MASCPDADTVQPMSTQPGPAAGNGHVMVHPKCKGGKLVARRAGSRSRARQLCTAPEAPVGLP